MSCITVNISLWSASNGFVAARLLVYMHVNKTAPSLLTGICGINLVALLIAVYVNITVVFNIGYEIQKCTYV